MIKKIKVNNATRQGFIECRLGGGDGHSIPRK